MVLQNFGVEPDFLSEEAGWGGVVCAKRDGLPSCSAFAFLVFGVALLLVRLHVSGCRDGTNESCSVRKYILSRDR